MNQHANQHNFECHFDEGDQVVLCLYPYNKTSLKDNHRQNLSPKSYDPYKVLKHIGLVAYKLELPSHSKIHPSFHVSCLNKVVSSNSYIQTCLPDLDEEGSIRL